MPPVNSRTQRTPIPLPRFPSQGKDQRVRSTNCQGEGWRRVRTPCAEAARPPVRVVPWAEGFPIWDLPPNRKGLHPLSGKLQGGLGESGSVVVDPNASGVRGNLKGSQNSFFRPRAFKTFRQTVITSGPMPSPGRVVKCILFMKEKHP